MSLQLTEFKKSIFNTFCYVLKFYYWVLRNFVLLYNCTVHMQESNRFVTWLLQHGRSSLLSVVLIEQLLNIQLAILYAAF